MKNMLNFKSFLAACLLFISFSIRAQNVFYIYSNVTGGAEPWTWAPPPFNSEVMDSVFGLEGTGWTRGYFETIDPLAVFNETTCTVYLEGGDSHDLPLSIFLAANQSMIEAWVFNGGHLLICSAPNYFGPINCGFGGVQINWPDYSSAAITVDIMHPIFQGPYIPEDNIWEGNYFAHASLSGGTLIPLLIDGIDGAILMAESHWGSGKLLFATLTVPGWHEPAPDGFNLKANMLTYLACDVCVPEIPTDLYADNIIVTKARLHWNAIEGVDKYKVLVYTAADGLVASKSTVNNYLNVKDLSPGTTYFFKVRSVCNETGEMSAFSSPASFTTLLRTTEIKETLVIYPNPANEQITISGIRGSEIQITLVDLLGEMVYSKNIMSSGAEINETMVLTNIPSGLYFINFNIDGITSTQKFIKQ